MNRQKMFSDYARARKLVFTTWKHVDEIVNNCKEGSDIRRNAAEEMFSLESDLNSNQITIEVKPIIFKVPERARNSATLYICVQLLMGEPYTNR